MIAPARVVSYLIVGDYNWLNATTLLIVPFAVFCWIFTTIRAIHTVGVWYWFIPSIYVTLWLLMFVPVNC